ncbi:hypothetical protein SAMN02745165_01690 [Malonomonas rubra DSM 5091]|uniref:Lipoprotein n=1 Tax=Malonomonas rubra DSM 5091 TaxID=1122189 RepID=A0A1M6H571_MALRU|nr:hypothetical protein [Malonomonas rubra]SHJ17330.1 hypothetical protein SAMN02745165_01690 [Malonomonas rubra DSM 5091]
MQKIWIMMVMMFVALTGCASTAKQVDVDTPQMLLSKEGNFFVYDYLDRHYVVGSEESSEKFAAHGHMPYAKTVLGAGPHGETVVFEIAKKDPNLTERLMSTYERTPFLVESKGDDYAVYKYMNRLYVVGSKESSEKFAAHGHMPYAKTVLGAGPAGETVVFEINKKEADLTERLMKMFKG